MNEVDYLNKYKQSLDGFKELSGYQFIALCPFHTDTKQSFNGEYQNGLWNCKACGVKGNGYQFAKMLNLPDAKSWITSESNGYNPTYHSTPDVKVETSLDLGISKRFYTYRDNLKKYIHKFDIFDDEIGIWEKELIDELGIGIIDVNTFVYAYYDINGNIDAYKVHNKRTYGNGSCRWYLGHLIPSYDKNKPLYICEGEKDAITLKSKGFQVVSGSAGAMSIPKKIDGSYDFDLFKDFKEIIIVYDNDKSGKKGAMRLAKAIANVWANAKLLVAQWNKELADKYDVTDSYMEDGLDFLDAVANATVIKTNNRIGGFSVITGIEADKIKLKDTVEIIETIMPENAITILGGTTGANKSYLAMQMAMSIANGEDEFLGFRINRKNLKVLYVDTEVGEQRLVRRYRQLASQFNWKASDNIIWIAKDDKSNVYNDIESAIKRFKPDIVIIDCLYNTCDNEDISKNANISKVTDRITELRTNYDITVFCIHHMNKYGHQDGLIIDRIAGGSALQNWAEHILLISRTNEASSRLLKMGKTRHTEFNDCYYKLDWNSEKFWLSNLGVTEDWRKLLITDEKKTCWGNVLRDLNESFTKMDFKNVVENIMGMTERTATTWIKQMLRAGVINKVNHGLYEKNLEIVKSEE